MGDRGIRAAYSLWPVYQQRWRDVVGSLTSEQLAVQPSPERWPLWATVGHAACQRVFWLCDFAGEPGAETTPFTNAAFDCPGDDDLEHVWSADRLVAALDSTFRIVEACLDRWSFDALDEVVSRPEWPGAPAFTRGAVIQRVFVHDVYHCAELNEALTAAGIPMVDFWEGTTGVSDPGR
jgi:hypothetical protein